MGVGPDDRRAGRRRGAAGFVRRDRATLRGAAGPVRVLSQPQRQRRQRDDARHGSGDHRAVLLPLAVHAEGPRLQRDQGRHLAAAPGRGDRPCGSDGRPAGRSPGAPASADRRPGVVRRRARVVRSATGRRQLPRRPAGPSLLIALGLGFAFVPITILAETGVHDREYGLASGLLNTSQQVGGALGLAVLTTIATSRTDHLVASHHTFTQALTLGFHLGFLGAAGFALLGIIAAATIGTRHGKRSQRPHPAGYPEPQTPETASISSETL